VLIYHKSEVEDKDKRLNCRVILFYVLSHTVRDTACPLALCIVELTSMRWVFMSVELFF
jgi:hypothetical protein